MSEREVSWVAFLKWAAGRAITSEEQDYTDGSVVLTFADGAYARVKSTYDGGYSEDTPGNGIEAPTVSISDVPLEKPPVPDTSGFQPPAGTIAVFFNPARPS